LLESYPLARWLPGQRLRQFYSLRAQEWLVLVRRNLLDSRLERRSAWSRLSVAPVLPEALLGATADLELSRPVLLLFLPRLFSAILELRAGFPWLVRH